jgi:uncharacterized repeat protein (TIGR03803 family)
MQGGSANCFLFGCGTIFSFNPATGAEKVLYFFQSSDGANPVAGLVQENHKLYGTTDAGGAGDCGTVFSFDRSTGKETVIHEFDRQGDGTTPGSALYRIGHTLYGTTIAGGSGDPGDGTVYAINGNTGVERVLYEFSGGDGAIPEDSPIAAKGLLYATASIGGATNNGTILTVDPSTGAGNVVHTFEGSDGSFPWADLIQIGTHLYGTTIYGGATGNGVIFSIRP